MGPVDTLLGKLSAFFATPRGQSYGFAGLGIAGLLVGVLGLWLLFGGGSDGDSLPTGPDSAAQETATPTSRATSTPAPTNTPRPDVTAPPRRTLAPRASPTPTVAVQGFTGGGGGGPAPTATPPPLVAAGDYCDTVGGLSPPSAIFGLLTIAGAPAPAGTVVTALFDGAPGPSVAIPEAGGYRVIFGVGGANCANHRAAAISIAVNGAVFSTGYTVASGDTGGVRFDIAAP